MKTMYITSDKAFDLLMQAFKDNDELDTASILVKWGDEVREYDSKQLQQVQRRIIPYYTLMHGTMRPQSPDEGRQFYQYAPDERLRVAVEDLAAFAKSRHLNVQALHDVALGKVQEYEGWRSYLQQGTSSREWTAPRDISNDDYEHNGSGQGFTRKEQEPYVPTMEPVVTDWTKE